MLKKNQQKLVTNLINRGIIKSSSVKEAFEKIPRELFLEGIDQSVPLKEVYKDKSYGIKREKNKNFISACSRPSLIASLIENLNLCDGHNILDIGTGSGVFASTAVLLGINRAI